MNLSDAGTATEFISPGFTARILVPPFSGCYNILFPVKTRAAINLQTQAYLELLKAANIECAQYDADPRVTYKLDMDFTNFKSGVNNIFTTAAALQSSPSLTSGVLSVPSAIDTSVYDGLWQYHTNPIYALAGFVAAYTSRLT